MIAMRVMVMSVALLAAVSGCAVIEALDTRAPAWWQLAPHQSLDPDSTSVTVLVSRIGCNDGITGTVNPPDVSVSDSEIVISMTVSPGEPSSATCPGNDQVAFEIELPEPLGDRRLVDGACENSDARRTIWCETDIRYAP